MAVLSLDELGKKSLHGGLFKPESEETCICNISEPFTQSLIPDFGADDDRESDSLMPDSSKFDFSEYLKRPEIYNMRLKYLNFGPTKKGLLPSASDISSFPKPETFIYMNPRPEEGQVGTAGFDLRAGTFIAWSDRVRTWHKQPFVSSAEFYNMDHKKLAIGEKFVLESDPLGNRVYYLFSNEGVLLSENLEMIVDSKSTTGRVGAMSHFAGFSEDGHVITVIQPYSFNLMIEAGKTRLAQTVIRYRGSSFLENGNVVGSGQVKFYGDNVSLEGALKSRGLQMNFDTRLIYAAKNCEEPIDMDAKDLDWTKYFEKIVGNDKIDTDKMRLYLLGSLGTLDMGNICGILSRESDVLTGTGAWGHFAGVFQPFFCGGITMEYYSFSNAEIKTGDNAGVVTFDLVEGNLKKPGGYGGSYQGQKPPRLPKMFKSD